MFGPARLTPSRSRQICLASSQSCARHASRNAITGAGGFQLAVRAWVKPNDVLPAQANLGVLVRQALVKGGFTVL